MQNEPQYQRLRFTKLMIFLCGDVVGEQSILNVYKYLALSSMCRCKLNSETDQTQDFRSFGKPNRSCLQFHEQFVGRRMWKIIELYPDFIFNVTFSLLVSRGHRMSLFYIERDLNCTLFGAQYPQYEFALGRTKTKRERFWLSLWLINSRR